MFPVVPRYAMASYIGVPDGIVRHNKLLKAQKRLIPLNPIFFRHPVYIYQSAPVQWCLFFNIQGINTLFTILYVKLKVRVGNDIV